MTAPCSLKQCTSGEASCTPANDKQSPKVVEMNGFGEPLSPLLSSQCCRFRLYFCISTPKGMAPGGGLAPSHSRCHSVLSRKYPLDPVTWQVCAEAGTLSCLFANRLAGVPSGLLIVACGGGVSCAPALSILGALEPAQGLPCPCNAITARTSSHYGLKGQAWLPYYFVSKSVHVTALFSWWGHRWLVWYSLIVTEVFSRCCA